MEARSGRSLDASVLAQARERAELAKRFDRCGEFHQDIEVVLERLRREEQSSVIEDVP